MKDFDATILSVVRARARAGRAPSAADHAGVHGRRGGRQHPGRAPDRRPAPRAGSRAAPRASARSAASPPPSHGQPDLPGRDRREGHRVAAAARPRHRRPRVDAQRRQRRHRDRARRSPRSADTSGRCGSPRRWATLLDEIARAHRPRQRRGRRRRAGRALRPGGPDARRRGPQHRQPDDAASRLQAQRHPRRGDRQRSTAASCRATRTSSSRRCASLLPDNVTYELLVHDQALETPFDGAARRGDDGRRCSRRTRTRRCCRS